MKKALVTGAAGFIGSHVVRELLAEGVEVRALIRPGEKTDTIQGLGVEMVEGDLLNADAVASVMKGIDTLFHLGAIYSIWLPDWSRIYEVNMQGSRNVLWAAMKAGVGRVVYTSSIAAVGIMPGKAPSDETTPFNQYTLGSHYILTKYLSQQEALGFAKHGLDLVVVNPCFPFGENDTVPTPTGQMIVDIVNGLVRTSFAGGVNVVDVRDVAKGHVLAAKKGRTGELYILGNKNMVMSDFISLVQKTAGMKQIVLPSVPLPIMTVSAHVFKWWADHVSHRTPLTTPSEVHYAAQYLFYDTSKARKELGLAPSPIEESLKRSIDWFRKHGYVK